MRGVWILARCKPQVLSIAAQNLTGRLAHQLSKLRGDGRNAPPEQITIIVTDQCNLRCKMCHYAHTNTADYQLNHVGKMPLELFYKLMDEIPGNSLISFTGGEPLLHPQIGDMVAYAKRSGCFTTLTTNGWLLAKCAQTLCETGLDVLVVSIDGPADIHDRIRGAGSFKRLTAGLEAILAQGRRPIVFVNMAISNLNYDQMVKMYDFALGWGVDGLNFNHLWFQDPDVVKNHNALDSLFIADEVIWDIEPEAVDPKQIADAFDVIWQRSRFAPIIVNAIPNLNRDEIAVWYKEPEQIVKYRTTRCGWIRLRVWPDGGVRMCRAWQAGNVAKTHAMDIWKGDKFRAFRQRLIKDMLPICALLLFGPQVIKVNCLPDRILLVSSYRLGGFWQSFYWYW